MAQYNRIFAALDGSDTQLAVARRTLSIAHDNNADVMFAHAIDPADFEQARIDVKEYVAKSKEAIESELERQLTRAMRDECIPSVEVAVAAGRINETLESMAEEFGPDLVICGVRGFSNIKYAFVGSTSTFLVRNVNCDVLVVHPEKIEDIDEAEYESAMK